MLYVCTNEYTVSYLHQFVLNMEHLLHICVKKELGMLKESKLEFFKVNGIQCKASGVQTILG